VRDDEGIDMVETGFGQRFLQQPRQLLQRRRAQTGIVHDRIDLTRFDGGAREAPTASGTGRREVPARGELTPEQRMPPPIHANACRENRQGTVSGRDQRRRRRVPGQTCELGIDAVEAVLVRRDLARRDEHVIVCSRGDVPRRQIESDDEPTAGRTHVETADLAAPERRL
jgi:hypothetical protein